MLLWNAKYGNRTSLKCNTEKSTSEPNIFLWLDFENLRFSHVCWIYTFWAKRHNGNTSLTLIRDMLPIKYSFACIHTSLRNTFTQLNGLAWIYDVQGVFFQRKWDTADGHTAPLSDFTLSSFVLNKLFESCPTSAACTENSSLIVLTVYVSSVL
jgi:hypothetical protein